MTRASSQSTLDATEVRVSIYPEVSAALIEEARQLPGFGLYHDAPWSRLLKQAFGWTVGAVAAHREERLIAYLPFVRKRRFGRLVYVCLPLSHDAGALLAAGESRLPPGLLNGVAPLELHAALPGNDEIGATSVEHVESVIELKRYDSAEAMFKGMSSSRRRKVRKALREGVVTRETTAAEDFEIFAELQSVTRRRQGAPDYPRRFFPAMAEHLGRGDAARLRLGFLDGRPVAGVILLRDPCRDRVIYGYGASVADQDVLATGVNPRLLWESMEEAFAEGFATFSFGSTAVHHDKLLAYKTRFGAVSVPLPRVRLPAGALPSVREGGVLNRIAQPVLRNLPMAVFRSCSSIILSEVA